MEIENATLLFFWVWFWFFKREGAGIRGIGSVHSFLIGSGLRLGREWPFVLAVSDYEGFPSA